MKIKVFFISMILLMSTDLSSVALAKEEGGSATGIYALEPNEILIIANNDIPQSIDLAQYYCSKRNVPTQNLLPLSLGAKLNDNISRTGYNKRLADPIRKKLLDKKFIGKIRCLLTTYGVPIRVGGSGPLKNKEKELEKLEQLIDQTETTLEQLKQSPELAEGQNTSENSAKQKENTERKLATLKAGVDRIKGKETGASVDSELSMVLYDDYELHRWRPNKLRYNSPYRDIRAIMVSRLDGPGFNIARNLIDKALIAEKTGLKGFAYIDSRGIKNDDKPYSFGYFDQSLRDLADFIDQQTPMVVKHENTAELFEPNSCPMTAIYCGWYKLAKYVDAFNFVNGAIGYHIASYEARNLRDPDSTEWCPAMLTRGITATLGPVAEPYLHSFPEPKKFFTELFKGQCLVEAYYHTKPFNSWQLVLIGDPLYRPFKPPSGELLSNIAPD